MKKRRAVSLVELLVVMSASTLILTLSATLVHRAMHTNSRTRDFSSVERSSLRLFDYFRMDVQQATKAVVNQRGVSEGKFLELMLPENCVLEYWREGDVVKRTVAKADFRGTRRICISHDV